MESLKKNVCHRWDAISDTVTCFIERWDQSKWHHEYNRILSKMRTAVVELWSSWSTSNFYVFFSLHSISNKISSSCSSLQVSFLLKSITHDHTSFPENKLLSPFCLADMKLGWASLVRLSPEEAGQGSEGVHRMAPIPQGKETAKKEGDHSRLVGGRISLIRIDTSTMA